MAERKSLARNRRAFHEYTIDDRLEVGIVLHGTEVKSMRANAFSFTDAYARIEKGELWLLGLHITEYTHGNIYNHEPTRRRKLLLHRKELERLRRKVEEKGFTLIPLEFYLKQGLIKLDLGVCKGKKLFDKRQSLKAKAQKRDMDREMRGRV